MFSIQYAWAELRRRRGRTILTALGLGVGVALVVAVTALSQGLTDAQDEVLRPLTGVGTDMSVSRPIVVDDGEDSGDQGGPFGGLSDKERQQLEEENGGVRVALADQGEPGEKFSTDNFVSSQLSFSSAKQREIEALDGVSEAAGGLTLSAIHVEGTVPENADNLQPGQAPQPGAGGGPPDNIDLTNISVSGVDETQPQLGAITESQISKGAYFSRGNARQAVVSESYASRKNLALGDSVKIKGKSYEIVGVASPPLGGQASDVYVKLSQLQAASDRKGRVNQVYVRATDTDAVASVSKAIETTLEGASVTTTQDLADRVGGSLVDAKNLASKLGTALAIVALIAAVLIAILLTLSSVAKRTRELGTLKAIGWKQGRVVRQVSGESLLQGALGGALGALLGIGAAALVGALGITLEASVAGAAQGGAPGGGGPGLLGGFGQGQVVSGTTDVVLGAPVSFGLVVLAISLAILGGLLAGAVGGLRAARLRPADALRTLD